MMRLRFCLSLLTLSLAVVLLLVSALAVSADGTMDIITGRDEWVTFLLICNEGMNNDKGDNGNAVMVLSLHPDKGLINLLMMTWDTFVDYEGYDVPQKLDMPFRKGGPEELVKVFNANFGTDIRHYISLNYLNLAALIDDFGGVDVDITRAERNALNGMIASRKNQLQSRPDSGLLSQAMIEFLAQDSFLTDFGPQTHLNGLQAVGFGWLQYDGVFNCCKRDVEIVASLFRSFGAAATRKVGFYTDESGEPKDADGKRIINLDHMTVEDLSHLRKEMAPVFEKTYNNLSEEALTSISIALATGIYHSARSDAADFEENLKTAVLPLEALQPYDIIAGVQGHRIDFDANKAVMNTFLYPEK